MTTTPCPSADPAPPPVPFTPSTPRFWLSVVLCALPWLVAFGLNADYHAAYDLHGDIAALPATLLKAGALLLLGSLLLHACYRRRIQALRVWQLWLYPLPLLVIASLAYGFIAGVIAIVGDEEINSPFGYVLMPFMTALMYAFRWGIQLPVTLPLAILTLALMRKLASPPRPVKPLL